MVVGVEIVIAVACRFVDHDTECRCQPDRIEIVIDDLGWLETRLILDQQGVARLQIGNGGDDGR